MTEKSMKYLEKITKEMPLGVFREIITVDQEKRDRNLWIKKTAGTMTKADQEDYNEITQVTRKCLDIVDAAIKEVGEDVTLSDDPNYDAVAATELFLCIFGLYRPWADRNTDPTESLNTVEADA